MPDLGKTYDGPSEMLAPEPLSGKDPEVHYPSLYIGDMKEPLGLPAEGEATVTFKIRSETKKTRNGKTCYAYDIDIKSIYPKKGGKAKPTKETSEALDDLLKEIIQEKTDD